MLRDDFGTAGTRMRLGSALSNEQAPGECKAEECGQHEQKPENEVLQDCTRVGGAV